MQLADLVFVAALGGFFALTWDFARLCERLGERLGDRLGGPEKKGTP